MKQSLAQIRNRRVKRVRGSLIGTKERPRLAVFRSNKHLSAQLIDDFSGTTLLAASDDDLKGKMTKREKAAAVGRALGEAAIKKGIKSVVFDRRSYKYHGRIAALADTARQAGLEF